MKNIVKWKVRLPRTKSIYERWN